MAGEQSCINQIDRVVQNLINVVQLGLVFHRHFSAAEVSLRVRFIIYYLCSSHSSLRSLTALIFIYLQPSPDSSFSSDGSSFYLTQQYRWERVFTYFFHSFNQAKAEMLPFKQSNHFSQAASSCIVCSCCLFN